MASVLEVSGRARWRVPRIRHRRTGLAARLSSGCISTTVSGVTGLAIARSPALAMIPLGSLVFAGLAAASVDTVLVSALAIRNFTDLRAVASVTVRGINPSAAVGLGVLLLAVVRLGHPRLAHRVPWALLLLLVGLSAWYAVAVAEFGPDGSLTRELIRSASVVAVGIIATVADRPRAFERTAQIVLATAVVPALVALGEAVAHVTEFSHGTWRSHATFAHENTAAVVFVTCAALALWLLRRYHSIWYLAAVVLFSAALITTGSLGGFAQAIVTLLALRQGFTEAQRLRRRRALVLILALLAVFAITPLGQERLSSLGATRLPVGTSQGAYANSLNWRFLNWSKFLTAWHRKPVLGLGLGATTSLVEPLGYWTHSDYVRLLVETGVVGSVLFVALGLGLVLKVRAVARSDLEDAPAATLMYALLLGLMTHALVETVSLDTPSMYMIAALIGALFSVRTSHRLAGRSSRNAMQFCDRKGRWSDPGF
jgi:O-antigen ligase